MRKKLRTYEETRGTFTGTFVREGSKNGYKGPERTLLLKDIKDINGNILCDHLWFNYTKGFDKLENLQKEKLYNSMQDVRNIKKVIKGIEMMYISL